MADSYELSIALDLGELSDAEVAELRWHLGLGPMPQGLSIVTEFPVVVVNDLGEPVIENEPRPLLGNHDPAWKVGGALTAALVPREGGWALTARQELHPDDCEQVGELLEWLAAKATDHHKQADGSVRIGWTRFYEDDQPASMLVRDGKAVWQ